MDRSATIGTVLIFIILLVWMWWLTPPTDLSPQSEPVADTQAVVAQREEAQALAEAAREEDEEELVDTEALGLEEGEARDIVIDNQLFTAVLSTRGATLRSFELKEYSNFDQESAVQMVDTSRAGAIGLAFLTPTNRNVDSRALYFESPTQSDTVRITDDAREIAFESRIGDGVLRKVYTFHPDEYHIDLRIESENTASFQTADGYELVWHGGIPFSEGDVDEEAQRAGAFVRSGGQVESIELQRDAEESRRFIGEVDWITVKNKFFTSVVMPAGGTRGAELDGRRTGTSEDQTLFEDYTARLLMERPDATHTFELYIGPMEYLRLAGYRQNLYDVVDFGWNFFEWMTRPLAKFVFIPSFAFLSNFIPNYGLVIIVFAILLKILLYPLTKSSYKSMAKMRELQPKMEAIKEKYGDDPQKQQQAMMKMYKETGVNPLGGCLPMLMQYPIIIALWMYLPQSIEMRQQGFLWANDLSAPDVILNLPFTIPLYGNFVAGFTLLMGISMIVQMRIQMASQMNTQAKIMTYVFPVMIFAIFNRLASGLSLYYLVYNVVTAIQQKWINMRTATGEDEKPKEAPKKKPSRSAPSAGGGKKAALKSPRSRNKRARS